MFVIWFFLAMALGIVAILFFGLWRAGFSVMPVKTIKSRIGEVFSLGLCAVFVILAMLCIDNSAKSWLAFIGVQ